MYQLVSSIPFMVCLVWTAILLMNIRKADLPHRALTAFGLATTILYFCHYLHFNGMQTVLSESVYFMCNLSVYPLYAIYVMCLTGKGRPSKKHLLWFVPAVLVFVFSITGVLKGLSGGAQFAAQLIFPFISLAATAMAAVNLFRFRASVNNYYSSPENKRLDPILVLLLLLLVTSLASFTVNLLGRDHFMSSNYIIIPALFFSVLLFAVFFFSFNTESPSEEVRIDSKQEPHEESHDESAQDILMSKIFSQMQDQQIFRSKGLTIMDLAEAVGSNRTYVSSCINKTTGNNFSDYVNSWRIEYAKALMKTTQLSITEIANLSGFADRTSFYRSFKKLTGKSPSEWLK